MPFFIEYLDSQHVVRVAVGVGDLKQVRGDRSGVFHVAEFQSDVVARWPFGGLEEGFGVFQKFFHAVGVRRENFGHVRLWPIAFGVVKLAA